MNLPEIAAQYHKALQEATLEMQRKVQTATQRMQMQLVGLDPDAQPAQKPAQSDAEMSAPPNITIPHHLPGGG